MDDNERRQFAHLLAVIIHLREALEVAYHNIAARSDPETAEADGELLGRINALLKRSKQ